MTGNKLKIFFMVEPGPLEVQAHLLISSLLVHCKDRFVMEGFCRAERLDGLQEETLEYLAQCDVDLTPITNDFADGYPAGNKLIAANAVTGADWYLFMDTDMVMVRDASIVSQIAQGQVGLCLDTINGWNNEDAQWKLLFGAAGINPPDEVIPYPHGGTGRAIYNAGLVAFPDAGEGRPHFGQVWHAMARKLDTIDALANRRPWLDTIALLPALATNPAWGPTRLDRVWNNTTKFATPDQIVIHYHGLRQLKIFDHLAKMDMILRASPSAYDGLWPLAFHYKRNLGVDGDLFRRAMRHGLMTLTPNGGGEK
jgi:hypothetical protein